MTSSISSFRNCKIVATVGPSSNSPDRLALLARTGVDVFRINFSHGDAEAHKRVIAAIRQMETMRGRPVGVLADLQGPKIRVGVLTDDEMKLAFGEVVELVCAEEQPGDRKAIPIPHPEIFEVSEEGDQLLFDDGRLACSLVSVEKDRAEARIIQPGTLKTRKGVNVPNKRLPISAITEKDRADLVTALDANVDFIALSFVQHPSDVEEARDLIAGRAKLIVKIEKPSALEHLEDILKSADAVMVARGDLGVELPPEQVPVHQRRIVRTARQLGRPVIVATQMLESMIESPVPTRAEASDVATAVYQGADAVMLSAESAVGRHPQTVVAIMDRIIRAIEDAPDFYDALSQYTVDPDVTTADAICQAAAQITDTLDCAAIVAYSSTGATGKRMSRMRPKAPILMLSDQMKTARLGALYWGIIPVHEKDIGSYEDMLQTAKRIAVREGVPENERIVIAAGFPFGRAGKTNLVQVTRVTSDDVD